MVISAGDADKKNEDELLTLQLQHEFVLSTVYDCS
jgi:hypothetical protein